MALFNSIFEDFINDAELSVIYVRSLFANRSALIYFKIIVAAKLFLNFVSMCSSVVRLLDL